MCRALAILLAAVALLTVAAPARAADDDGAVRARLAFVEHALDTEQPRARHWRNAWLVTFAALAVGQGGFAWLTTNRGYRVDAAVGGAKSALGFLALLVGPHTNTGAADRVAAMPARTHGQRRDKLRLAEALLVDSAKEERFEQSWMPRIASAVVNLAGAYVMWIGYQRYTTGWLSIGSGLAVSELEIRTAPVGLTGFRAGPASPSIATSWTIAPVVGGLSLTGSF